MTERLSGEVMWHSKVARVLTAALLFILMLFVMSCQRQTHSPNAHIVPIPDAEKVVAYLIVAREPGSTALAHYTEHLAWLPNIGTGSRPLSRDTNAFTGPFAIVYWLSGTPDELPNMLSKLAGVFAPIDQQQRFADEEADIVLREYEQRIASNPDSLLSDEMQQFVFAGNELATSTVQLLTEIQGLNYDAARAYQARTHKPERTRLLVAGNTSASAVAAALDASNFPDLGDNANSVSPPPFTLAAPVGVTLKKPRSEAATRMIWRKVITLPQAVDYNLLTAQANMLRDILDTNLPGGLAKPLRYDAFITESFSVSVQVIDEKHLDFQIIAVPDKSVSFVELQTALEAELASSAKGIPQATFSRVQKRISDGWRQMQSTRQFQQWMAEYAIGQMSQLRVPLDEAEFKRLDGELTLADINILISALNGPGRKAVAFIGKDHKLEE